LSDAILTVGIFDPATFAGGSMRLDKQRAAEAIATVATPLGMCIEDAALAIIDIAHASMINALKLVTVQRGHDPRDVVFVVSGGAGPALATRLGRDLNVKATVIPPYPGIFSAWGMLAAEPRADFRGTWFCALTVDAMAALSDRFDGLEDEALAYFAKGENADIRFAYQVEARYRGQEHGVFIYFQRDDDVDSFAERFHAAHERAYSFRLLDAAIEITTLHLEAVLNGPVITLPKIKSAGGDTGLTGHRDVYFGAAFGWVSCPVYARGLLAAGQSIKGPIIVEEATATTLVQENQVLDVTDTGILIVRENSVEAG
jgi:N-methylhydantoinase A